MKLDAPALSVHHRPMKRHYVVLLLALLPVSAFAQNPKPLPLPISVDIIVVPPGGDPATGQMATRNTPVGAASSNCNQATVPAAPTPLLNPTKAYFDDPFNAGRFCFADLPVITNPGTGYVAVGVFNSDKCERTEPDGSISIVPCSSPRSAAGIPTFDIGEAPPPQDPCVPGSNGLPAVEISVGEWTRSVSPNANGRVTFSMLRSRHAITQVVVNFNGVETDRLTGSDLRKVAGSYFASGAVKGSFMLSVVATDAMGCSNVANRPMTVNVK